MVGRKILFAFGLMFFLFFIQNSYATDFNSCLLISSAGYYRLTDSFVATSLNTSKNGYCIYIETGAGTARANVTIDLNDRVITGGYNSSVLYGIGSTDSNIRIMNGEINNFSAIDAGVGIANLCGVYGCSDITISNVRLIDNNVGLKFNKVNNSFVQVAIDNPNRDTGLRFDYVHNITLNGFVRAKTYGAILYNITNSTITGHYDTNIIITENQTTILGYLDIFHLLPPTVTTTTQQIQSKGMGIAIVNSSSNVFKDISAVGLIQGIWLSGYSTNNILGRIDCVLSGQYTGGKFGGVWLDIDAKHNKLCEIRGNIIDFCNQWLLSSTCSGKNNIISDSCENIFNPSSYGTATDISLVLLTPLLPAISSTDYGFVSFLTTPFFLVIFLMSGLAIVVAKTTKNATFGLYTLMFLVFILTAITFTTFWIGFIFVIVIGFLLYKTAEKKEESA
jgi:hypothetical protein